MIELSGLYARTAKTLAVLIPLFGSIFLYIVDRSQLSSRQAAAFESIGHSSICSYVRQTQIPDSRHEEALKNFWKAESRHLSELFVFESS